MNNTNMIKKFRLKKRHDDEQGEVMLEAAIIMFIVMVLLMVLLAMGFVFYQMSIMETIAVEEAENISRNYKYMSDGSTFDITAAQAKKTDISNIKKYRNTFYMNRYKSNIKNKMSSVIADRIGLSSLGITDDVGEPEVEIISDNYGRMHAKVVLSLKFTVIFSEILEYTGITDDSEITFKAAGYSEIRDLTAHNSIVGLSGYLVKKVKDNMSNVNKIVNSINTAINSVKRIFKL